MPTPMKSGSVRIASSDALQLAEIVVELGDGQRAADAAGAGDEGDVGSGDGHLATALPG
jgi:hypothetical protein